MNRTFEKAVEEALKGFVQWSINDPGIDLPIAKATILAAHQAAMLKVLGADYRDLLNFGVDNGLGMDEYKAKKRKRIAALRAAITKGGE